MQITPDCCQTSQDHCLSGELQTLVDLDIHTLWLLLDFPISVVASDIEVKLVRAAVRLRTRLGSVLISQDSTPQSPPMSLGHFENYRDYPDGPLRFHPNGMHFSGNQGEIERISGRDFLQEGTNR